MSIGAPLAASRGTTSAALPTHADRQRLAPVAGVDRHPKRFVDVVDRHVEVARLDPPLDPAGVDVDAHDHAVVHRDRERLCAAHPAEAGRERDRPCERPAALGADRRERLVRALQDPLRADVDPRPRGHLPVHREPEGLEPAELLPRGPLGDEVAVRDQHAGRPFVRLHHTDRLARLDQQGLVAFETAKLPHDRVECLPGTRRPAGAAVDDQIVGALGHLGVEVVHQHAQRGFLRPALAGQLGATGRAHLTGSGGGRHSPPHAAEPVWLAA